MTGIAFSELIVLFVIGLVILGPKRLPEVASRIGRWIGQARRMTQQMRRQLEDELGVDRNFNIRPSASHVPHDDDTYSPAHIDDAPKTPAAAPSVDPAPPEVAGAANAESDAAADTSADAAEGTGEATK